MTIKDIMNIIRDIKGEFQNGLLTSEELVETLEDLIHDVEGNDEYSGFGETLEDDGFYDEVDFTKLEV